MKISQMGLVFFSPTGSTKKVLKTIAQKFSTKTTTLDLTNQNMQKAERHYGPEDFIIFGVPVYAGRVPKTAVERIKNISGNHTPAAVVVTYGNRAYEDALLELKELIEGQGFKAIGGGAFITEHSIFRSVAKGRPNQEDMAAIGSFGVQLSKKLEALTPEELKQLTLTVSGNTPYRKYKPVPLRPHATDSCRLCRACARQCPTGAINPDKLKKCDKKKCISCMRCVRTCPNHARTVNKFLNKLGKKKLERACREVKKPEIFI